MMKLITIRNKASMCICTYGLIPVYSALLAMTLLTGCEKPDNNVVSVSSKVEEVPAKLSKALVKTSVIEHVNKIEVFAPTVENERHGKWLGGIAPHNKRASKVDTYYRIKAAEKPNHLTMTLRFEGIFADDAKIAFRPIDGAKFKLPDQQSVWRLKPGTASEITFTLVVPDSASYLALDTMQNNQGAARAFVLKLP